MQQQELRQQKTAMTAFVVLSLMTVVTFVIFDNAMHIGPLVHLEVTPFIWAMVGLGVTCFTCGATAFVIGAWLLKHRVRNTC